MSRFVIVALECVAIAWLCAPALALNPERTIAQLHHTAWTPKEGAPTEIVALAQTADGFLWLATGAGLFRFDGVTFERVVPVNSAPITTSVSAVLGVPSGELFIGYRYGGVSVLKDGRLTSYSEKQGVPSGAVYRFLRDSDGTVWAATFGGLARFDGRAWSAVNVSVGSSSSRSFDVSQDRHGNLWIDNGRTLVVRPSKSTEFIDTGVGVNRMVLAVSPKGVAWLEDGLGAVRTLTADGKPSRPAGGWRFNANPQGMIFDRDGALWVATMGQGVQRVPNPEGEGETLAWSKGPPEAFAHAQGLTTDFATSILEDREGNIWVGTRAGLDRFRDSNLAPIVIPDYALQLALGADRDGSMWIGSLNRPLMKVEGSSVAAQAVTSKITCAYRDPTGTLWLAGPKALYRRQGDGFVLIPLPDVAKDGDVQTMVMDADGGLWLSIIRAGLFRFHGGKWALETRFNSPPTLVPLVSTMDGTRHTWFGFSGSKLVRLRGNDVETFSRDAGVGVGDVTAIFARDDRVWIGGTNGLDLFMAGRFRSVLVAEHDLHGVSGIVETGNGELWLAGTFGILRIARDEVDRAVRDAQHHMLARRFDFDDGLPGLPQQFRPLPSAVQGVDGRLWFSTIDGVVWVDPKRLPINLLAPPVVIRSIAANGKTLPPNDGVQLAIGTRDLQIDYTALSLSIPERVRFRFRLDGFDREWHDAGTRRQAFYTNLRPGSYRFRVAAANNDGVWNEAGATVQFAILPAFYQTAWFLALSILAATAMMWMLYRVRVRQVARRVRDRLEARLMERVRIARELHDTLLQSTQGLILHVQAAASRLPQSEHARQLIEQALDRADEVMAEGRARVKDLRASDDSQELPAAITEAGEDFAATKPASFRVVVQGSPRALHPVTRDEAYLVAREALSNAFRHANARAIEVEVTYGRRDLRLRITDDGTGIDVAVMQAGGRAAHWGLPGMRERARKIGADFHVWSRPGAGTEITLTVPAFAAYVDSEVTV
ncbi:MAG TPA: two-component regulator propeller domain-containing protein [Vicinamibacterales bacterium]|nr:two-component regulator propeller domain-containing protein [Vicinamibacterales bacterium]